MLVMPNGGAALKNSWEVPQKAEHRFILSNPAILLLVISLKRTEKVCPYENLYKNVHHSISLKSQKMDTTQMLINL